MTKAEEFIKLWWNQKKTISVKALAEKHDPRVAITRNKGLTEYLFHDASRIHIRGRGKNHKLTNPDTGVK